MPFVFDIEADGLLDKATKIHVMAWTEDGQSWNYTHDYSEMADVLLGNDYLCGHYIKGYDIPLIERILGIDLSDKTVIDTLALSWYLHHNRSSHGLESYGEDYGIPKPKITDWESLTPEDYRNRCVEDVKINWRLWMDLDLKLTQMYSKEEDKWRLIRYLTFKMDCVAKQEFLGWTLDVDMASQALEEMTSKMSAAEEELADAMPRRPIFKVLNKPKVMFKKDGSYSSAGERWVEACKANHQPTSVNSFTIVNGYEMANPNSTPQVKEWLESLGWVPQTFKFVKGESQGQERMIPQVRKDGELCPSVLELADKDPAILKLDGLTVLQHRAAILKSFLESVDENGKLKATVAGFTNTLRFRHSKPLVNLPGVDKPYGDIIRGVLIAGKGKVLCGSDMTSLEDTTKRHYIQPLDPEYVAEMQKPGFDPHLDLAVFAGAITRDDYNKYGILDKAEVMTTEERSFYKRIKAIRKSYKVVNYSATYGVGAAKLARETGLSTSEAKALLEAFWKRNWAIQAVCSKVSVRTMFGSSWLLNPVSGFWYSLRSEKDIFSTLNQSTGVYCFDTWLAFVMAKGVPIVGQFHDEWIGEIDEGSEAATEEAVRVSTEELNARLSLNVPLGCDVQFGPRYSSIH